MKQKILVNVEDTHLRVAFLENGKLAGLQIESNDDKSIVGNIYKGRVDGIVPGLKAVFVNIGMERNAFLHFSDVGQEYSLPSSGRPTRLAPAAAEPAPNGEAPLTVAPVSEAPPAKRSRNKKDASRPLKVGDSIVVQASKDEIGDKGPRVNSYISLPGRYLVYLPNAVNEGGVSRRINDQDERRRLRKILKDIKADEGSFIVRTAGLEQSEEAIKADVANLQRQWRSIARRAPRAASPSLLYNDHELLYRLVRDSFPADDSEVLIDDEAEGRKLQRTIKQLMPDAKLKVDIYKDSQNLFDAYDVERQVQKALKSKVWLKSGGCVIIEETESMTAIDVNTGKYVGRGDQEETILKTNLEAAAEIAHQLRVRDIGGIIVVDFIDMVSRKNQDALMREINVLLKQDRAKTSVCATISDFGLVQITRKRVRQSLLKTLMAPCPYCEGRGRVLTHAQVWKGIKYELIRALETQPPAEKIETSVHPDIRKYLEEEILEAIKALATRYKAVLTFVIDPNLHLEKFNIRKIEHQTRKTSSRRRSSRGKSRQKALNQPKPTSEAEAPARIPEKTLEPVPEIGQ